MRTVTMWLAAAVLMVSSAWASPDWPPVIGSIENKAGGRIIFSSTRCEGTPARRIAYIRDLSGKISAFGCWHYSNKQLWVFWNDGDVFTYDIEAFEPSPEFDAMLQEREGVQS